MTNQKTAIIPKKKKATRLLALDAARGLAVIGMYIQHFALNERNANIVSGNTMILFILCSGISFSIMSRNAQKKGEEPNKLNARVLARAVFIDFLGYFIILLNGPFGAILSAYAGLFVIALFLKNLSDRKLTVLSATLFILSPIIMIVGMAYFSNAAIIADLVSGPLSSIGMLPIFTMGMLIGRKDTEELKSTKRAITYVAVGILLLVCTKLFAAYVLPGISSFFETWLAAQPAYMNTAEIDEYAIWPRNCMPVMWHMLFTAIPQSGTIFQLLMGTGAALLVLGACILIEKKFRFILKPFSKVGQVALTMYTLQFIIAWVCVTFGIPYGFGDFIIGDILVGIVTTLIGCGVAYAPFGFFEGWMRKVEKLFL